MMAVTERDEALLLALLNTTPTIDGQRTDRLADLDSARAWAREVSGQDHDEDDVILLRATRNTLQALVHGAASPPDLAPALEAVSFEAVLTADGITWELGAPAGRGLAARAVIVWDALQRTAAGRLRSCENTEGCSLFFVDHSKSNSARWCSMASCGNRMKARRHYERQKNARPTD